MLTYLQSASIILAGLLLTGLSIWIINRFWRTEQRKYYNDIIGWQFGVLGTIYAVTIAFVTLSSKREVDCQLLNRSLRDGASVLM